MARVYADLIIKGIKTINDVPLKLREEVMWILTKMKENSTSLEEDIVL